MLKCNGWPAVGRGRLTQRFLLTTDGLDLYAGAVSRVFGFLCIYAQVIKEFRNNRVCRVDRWLVCGSQAQLTEALFESEDSSMINTSFVERLNLTIRQGCAYLSCRSAGHARFAEHLEDQMALLQCRYNFTRNLPTPVGAALFALCVRARGRPRLNSNEAQPPGDTSALMKHRWTAATSSTGRFQ